MCTITVSFALLSTLGLFDTQLFFFDPLRVVARTREWECEKDGFGSGINARGNLDGRYQVKDETNLLDEKHGKNVQCMQRKTSPPAHARVVATVKGSDTLVLLECF